MMNDFSYISQRKIEPRLEEEIKRVKASAEMNRTIPVIIEHIKEVKIPPGKDPTTQLNEVTRQMHDLQQGIVARLSELGVVEIHQGTLANFLITHLTPAQINEIIKHGDVKFVRLNREDHVTANLPLCSMKDPAG